MKIDLGKNYTIRWSGREAKLTSLEAQKNAEIHTETLLIKERIDAKYAVNILALNKCERCKDKIGTITLWYLTRVELFGIALTQLFRCGYCTDEHESVADPDRIPVHVCEICLKKHDVELQNKVFMTKVGLVDHDYTTHER